jgi:chemotaxis protein methyltransferase CheR
MSTPIPDEVLDRFDKEIVAHFGLHFPENRRQDLARNLHSISREFGFDDPTACVNSLLGSPLSREQIEILTSHLTIGETYFFRDKRVFEVLEQRILPDLIAARRNSDRCLRIWSAACSSAEEPYSIAILLTRLLPDWKAWNITILGSDINVRALRKAAEGIYTKWSFRNAPPWLMEYFTRRGTEERYQLNPEIRKMVTLNYHNLTQDPYPSVFNNTNAMDIILCHNALMYFSRKHVGAIVENFHKALSNGGWLTVSATETPLISAPGFKAVDVDGQFFFRRIPEPLLCLYRPPAKIPAPKENTRFLPRDRLDPTTPSPAMDARPELRGRGDNPGRHDGTTAPTRSPEPPINSAYDEACLLFRQGCYAEAAQRLKSIEEPAAFALLARSYANLGRLHEALQWCEKAIGSDKLNPGHHYLRASILQELRRFDEAVTALKHTLYLDGRFILAHLSLGHLFRTQGKLMEATRHMTQAQVELLRHPKDEVVEETEGLTAGHLLEIVAAVQPGVRP